jgi:hypothetical protein
MFAHNAARRVLPCIAFIGLFIFLAVFVAMPAVNDALNNFDENMTRSVAYADSTQQFIKIPLEPSYSEGIGTKPSHFILVMDDFNFSKLMSVMVNFNVFVKEDTTFFATVDGRECQSPKFFADGGGSRQVTFDCTNAIAGAGKYDIEVVADYPVSSAFGWAEVSYLAEDKICPAIPDVKTSVSSALADYKKELPAKLELSGTEYVPNDNGTIFLQLLDAVNQPIDNSKCYLTMYYPSKSVFLNNVQMMYLLGSNGLYYYDFAVPNATGVYMVSADCYYYYNFSSQTSVADSYISFSANATNYGNLTFFAVGHVASIPLVSLIQFNLSNLTMGNITSAYLYLNKYSGLSNPVVNVQRITSAWNESNVTWSNRPSINTTVLDSVVVTGNGWYSWNITNTLLGWLNGSVPNYGLSLNATFSSYSFNFSTFYSREINSTYTPLLLVNYYVDEQMNEIRGSGEAHVSASMSAICNTTAISQDVWNYSSRTLTDYNSTQIYNALLALQSNQNAINSTVNQILAVSQAVNLTIQQTLGIAIEMNLTTQQIFSLLKEMNQTDIIEIGYLSEINQTSYNNALSLQQVLGFANQTNLTTQQILSLLQQINTTFEIKLDNMNNSLNSLLNLSGEINATSHEVNVTVYQILSAVQGINITTTQTYGFLQAMNLTQSQIYSVLLGMNISIAQILSLSNLTYINTNDILLLSFQTNSTVNQILGIVQGLNISINNTLSGNITLSSNLTSQSINDISEKVWLQFLTLGTPPPMPSTSYYCSDNVTLVKNITFDVCSGAGCKKYTKLTNSFCESGCDFKTNQCVPPPIERMGFIVAVIIGAIAFIVIVRRFT